MANEEQVAILRQGVKIWNQWLQENWNVKLDLRGLHLVGLDLSEIKMYSAFLTRIDFSHSNLYKANLSNADLSGANLSNADLSRANLNGTTLNKARLGRTLLRGTCLVDANLANAVLDGAILGGTDLRGANLRSAKLEGTQFVKANVNQANLNYAKLNYTAFDDMDLSQAEGLDAVQHWGPSTIGIDTIYKSSGNIPESFLQGAGVPDNFIEYMNSLTGEAFNFYSCFVSHSSKDHEFAERLYADLQSRGVRCWYAPEDMKTGDRVRQTIFDQIRLHEKLLLVLSEQSLSSGWVEDEVDKALDEEKRHSKQMLFPIRLDNAVMETDQAWAVKIRNQRHITDFTKWKHHDAYQQSFDRLTRDLKVESHTR
ncbi:MAG: toll/interleukin-1 receptor domain-containing protein [Chloroflexota bacterium]